jgi:hypothetical protein
VKCGHCKRRLETVQATGRPRRYCSDACRVAAYRRRRKRSVHFSSRSDEWPTPADVFAELDSRWMRKAWEASQTTASVVVCLVPARTCTAWWHDYAARGEVTFRRGRIRFGDAKSGAPFPSAVVVFRNAPRVTKVEAAA